MLWPKLSINKTKINCNLKCASLSKRHTGASMHLFIAPCMLHVCAKL